MTDIINKWRVTITSDGSHGFPWRDEHQGPPTVGPNGEAITTSLSRIVEVRDPNEVAIKEEAVPTGGHYKAGLIKFSAAANQISTHNTSFPWPVNILSGLILISTEMQGDIISWGAAPNTTVGAITASISISDTVINVQQTVVDNCDIGFKVNVADAGDPVNTSEDLGYCIAVDKENLQITVENAAVSAWSAALPTLVQISPYWMDAVELGPIDRLEFAKNKQLTAHVPANTPIICTYNNKHATDAKTVYCYYEYIF